MSTVPHRDQGSDAPNSVRVLSILWLIMFVGGLMALLLCLAWASRFGTLPALTPYTLITSGVGLVMLLLTAGLFAIFGK